MILNNFLKNDKISKEAKAREKKACSYSITSLLSVCFCSMFGLILGTIKLGYLQRRIRNGDLSGLYLNSLLKIL